MAETSGVMDILEDEAELVIGLEGDRRKKLAELMNNGHFVLLVNSDEATDSGSLPKSDDMRLFDEDEAFRLRTQAASSHTTAAVDNWLRQTEHQPRSEHRGNIATDPLLLKQLQFMGHTTVAADELNYQTS